MYAVFGLKKVLVFITALVVLVIIGLMVKEAPTDLVEFGKTAWKVSSGVVTAFIVFGSIPFVYRRAWKCYELIFKDAYPDLSGEWIGTIESNYSVHRATQLAAASTSETLNLLDPMQIEPIPLEIFEAKLTIKASLLKINVLMEVQGLTDKSDSYSIAAAPIVAQNDEPHRLVYVYKSKHFKKAADDESSHTGAAEVQVTRSADGSLHMTGYYWTARNWRRAGNTAGVLSLVRLSY
ncbi:hypothetical protein ULF88_15895 [Halopseudomonas pachastrellae]|nr:hypothetical protein [Halopseudomonas pachastrellae]WVM89542.1 hypothetical protein UMZ34_02870 [Halopseudomonas pachastrellae]|tara:strand:+ start:275 stop:982 length:708 start_codon:yes stop_codon:yes gene_type:complete